MKPHIYLRTELTVPGVGVTTHVAELADNGDGQRATLLRIIELMPNDVIGGAADQHHAFGMDQVPDPEVPHPDTYDDYPDLDAQRIDREVFEALWEAARRKFPDL